MFSLKLKVYYVFLAVFTAGGDKQECTCGFISMQRLLFLSGDRGSTTQNNWQQRIHPGLKFTCSGYLTKWTFLAQWRNQSSFPEAQIWRVDSSNSYTLVNSTTLHIETESSRYMYEYEVIPPVQFKTGDVVGIFQPLGTTSDLTLYYEEDSGPADNFFLVVNQYNENTFQLNATDLMTDMDLPLITPEIGKELTSHFLVYRFYVVCSQFPLPFV